MQQLPIRHVRADLASLVRQAHRGERTIITVAGQPVAQLGPLDTADHTSLADLVARGWVIEPARRDDGAGTFLPSDPVPVWSGARLDRLLREVRG